jgi:hypothetical protein
MSAQSARQDRKRWDRRNPKDLRRVIFLDGQDGLMIGVFGKPANQKFSSQGIILFVTHSALPQGNKAHAPREPNR